MGERAVGVVAAFDAERGLGEVELADGRRYSFHCVEIADGSRTIAVGARVAFELVPRLGRLEAAHLEPSEPAP